MPNSKRLLFWEVKNCRVLRFTNILPPVLAMASGWVRTLAAQWRYGRGRGYGRGYARGRGGTGRGVTNWLNRYGRRALATP
jgi:hypothetical protein